MKTTRSGARQPKKRKTLNDPFASFKQATAEAFSFLVDDFGFEQVLTGVHAPECEIKYFSSMTGVTITYEWGGVVWVDLSRLKRTAAQVIEDEKYSLDVLMLECCPNHDITKLYPAKQESSEQYVVRVIPEYANILKECGGDILAGDFRVFPKLTKLADEVLRRRNKELFRS